mmetsp:Transcript_5549/g.13233  ORF Transcript_5549/g.13233 Transcript_5549/m.13233 type:complete len:223 (-) Transcript_5549:66-734(-)
MFRHPDGRQPGRQPAATVPQPQQLHLAELLGDSDDRIDPARNPEMRAQPPGASSGVRWWQLSDDADASDQEQLPSAEQLLQELHAENEQLHDALEASQAENSVLGMQIHDLKGNLDRVSVENEKLGQAKTHLECEVSKARLALVTITEELERRLEDAERRAAGCSHGASLPPAWRLTKMSQAVRAASQSSAGEANTVQLLSEVEQLLVALSSGSAAPTPRGT